MSGPTVNGLSNWSPTCIRRLPCESGMAREAAAYDSATAKLHDRPRFHYMWKPAASLAP